MRLSTLKQEVLKICLKNNGTVYVCIDDRKENKEFILYGPPYIPFPSYIKLAFVIKPKNKK